MILEKFGKSGTPADFTVCFSLYMIFLFPSFLLIMSLFNADLDLLTIHQDICKKMKASTFRPERHCPRLEFDSYRTNVRLNVNVLNMKFEVLNIRENSEKSKICTTCQRTNSETAVEARKKFHRRNFFLEYVENGTVHSRLNNPKLDIVRKNPTKIYQFGFTLASKSSKCLKKSQKVRLSAHWCLRLAKLANRCRPDMVENFVRL
jgi:hypothetical protein